ncbi:MAG: hypothetical protein ACRYHQ_30605 [Janthinobacterium lividum]
MPSQADAENAIIALAATALYPAGLSSPSTTGATTRIFRGWPNAAALDVDLAAGRVNVTVFPVPGATRITTRYPTTPTASPAIPSLTAQVTGNTATFSGTASPGQLAGLLVEGQAYVYRTAAGDTPALVASILAAAITADRPALSSGASVFTPGAVPIARTAADATATTELRRQRQTFRMTAWCPTPDMRDATCAALDPVFAAIPFLTLADGSAARLAFVSTTTFDQSQDAGLYRRDLLYSVEFPTTLVAIQPSMLFGVVGLGTDIITA